MGIMKRAFLVCLVAITSATGLMAQQSIIGKWKIVGIQAQGINIDLENPVSGKKLISAEIEKQSGKAPDSATVNQAYTMFASMFEGMSVEFTKDGKGIAMIPDGTGGLKADTASYTVDYSKGIVKTESKEEGMPKNEEMTIKFDGDYLVMIKTKDGETMRLKRTK